VVVYDTYERQSVTVYWCYGEGPDEVKHGPYREARRYAQSDSEHYRRVDGAYCRGRRAGLWSEGWNSHHGPVSEFTLYDGGTIVHERVEVGEFGVLTDCSFRGGEPFFGYVCPLLGDLLGYRNPRFVLAVYTDGKLEGYSLIDGADFSPEAPKRAPLESEDLLEEVRPPTSRPSGELVIPITSDVALRGVKGQNSADLVMISTDAVRFADPVILDMVQSLAYWNGCIFGKREPHISLSNDSQDPLALASDWFVFVVHRRELSLFTDEARYQEAVSRAGVVDAVLRDWREFGED
jgi:hypothetical protein